MGKSYTRLAPHMPLVVRGLTSPSDAESLNSATEGRNGLGVQKPSYEMRSTLYYGRNSRLSLALCQVEIYCRNR